MSVKAMDAVLASRVTPPSLKLTLLVLANHLNKDTHRCDPGVDSIAEQVGVSRSQALRLIGSLKAAGLVAVRQRGGHQSSQYTLNFAQIAAFSGSTDATPRRSTGATSETTVFCVRGRTDANQQSHARDVSGRTSATSGVAPVLPKPEVEPEVEPEENLPSLRDGAASQPVGPQRIDDWIAAEKAAGRKALPDDDEVFTYEKVIGLPEGWLFLAWQVFKRHRAEKGWTSPNWRQQFRLAIEQDWLKLWRFDREGNYVLTTAGAQAQKMFAAEHA
jgi:hypothetical protein